MLRNYLKIAFRQLWRNKSFSAINLFGLTLGTACCLYILLYVQHHRSYDRHHAGVENLYRIISDLNLSDDGETMHMATCSPPIAPAMQEDFPEVELAARVCSHPAIEQNLIRYGEKVFYETKGYYVDSTFFRLFDYHFVAGDAPHALDEPFSAVLSAKLARKIFGAEAAIGQTIAIGGASREQDFKVTGVYDHSLGRSHLEPEFFVSMNSGGIGGYVRNNNSWAGNNFIYGYVRLRPGADPQTVEARLPEFLQTHGAEQFAEINIKKVLHLPPVAEIHTNTGLDADQSTNTSSTFLRILLLIAGFIQLVACINFMNLSTARSIRRAREVGIRKAVGAPRAALIGQFLGESFLLTLLAVGLALPLMRLALPLVNNLMGLPEALEWTPGWKGLGFALLLVLATGLIAGSYPAFYLSGFRPAGVLRGLRRASGGSGAEMFRKGLVVSQFTISVVLIIGALIIRQQLNYLLDKDLGFDKEQKIVIPFHDARASEKLETFRSELLRMPEIGAATGMEKAPGQSLVSDIPLYKEGGSMSSAVDIQMTGVDENFFQTLQIDLLAGRSLTRADTAVSYNDLLVVVNEKALEELGYSPEEAPGKVLHSDFENQHITATIVGVMENVHYQTLGAELRPFMVTAGAPADFRNLIADVQTDDYPVLMSKVEALWQKLLPDLPFEFSFLDADIARLYQTERTLSRIVGAFTLMAILISCLGLFGLSVFAAEQRTKEIGIRKVLGASTVGIVQLLSKDYLKLVVLALLLSSPLAYFIMTKWLDHFAYRTGIEWWVFLAAGLAALAVTLLTVSFQSLKAAWSDPVESLRSE